MTTRRRVYVCHPLAGDIAGNIARVRDIARRIALEEDVLPVAPHVYLSFLNDLVPEERALAIAFCLDLVALCDEVRVYGRRRGDESQGMRGEVVLAQSLGIPIRWMEEENGEPQGEGEGGRPGEGPRGEGGTDGPEGPAPAVGGTA